MVTYWDRLTWLRASSTWSKVFLNSLMLASCRAAPSAGSASKKPAMVRTKTPSTTAGLKKGDVTRCSTTWSWPSTAVLLLSGCWLLRSAESWFVSELQMSRTAEDISCRMTVAASCRSISNCRPGFCLSNAQILPHMLEEPITPPACGHAVQVPCAQPTLSFNSASCAIHNEATTAVCLQCKKHADHLCLSTPACMCPCPV